MLSVWAMAAVAQALERQDAAPPRAPDTPPPERAETEWEYAEDRVAEYVSGLGRMFDEDPTYIGPAPAPEVRLRPPRMRVSPEKARQKRVDHRRAQKAARNKNRRR